MKTPVHIIGAGFSGLSLAYRLGQNGIPVIVYDRSDEVGGMISTHKMNPSLAESAAPSISRTARVERLCTELGLEILEPSKKSKNRFIFRGRARKWPLGVLETLGLIYQILKAKITSQLRPRAGETLEQWGQRNLGAVASHFTLETAMQGIYAGDSGRLSASLILGPMFNPNRERFKGTLGFKNGMSDLMKALKLKIESQGGLIRLKSSVDLSLLHGPIVIATSADRASEILKSKSPEASDLLGQIEMIPLVTATLNFPLNTSLPEGFGCLIPRSQNLQTLGVLINSSIFERNWNVRCETWIIGGATGPDAVTLSEDEIKNLILTERKQIFNDSAAALSLRAFRWNKALPHYTVELEKILFELENHRQRLETEHQIFLHGNYLGGVGLSKILEQSDKLAEKIKQKVI